MKNRLVFNFCHTLDAFAVHLTDCCIVLCCQNMMLVSLCFLQLHALRYVSFFCFLSATGSRTLAFVCSRHDRL